MTKRYKTLTATGSLALAAALAFGGPAWAKKPSGNAVSGDLSPDRTSVTVTVAAQCDSLTQGTEGSLSVYIFQPSGRLLNLGLGSDTVTCDNPVTVQSKDVVVNAVDGLAFKPGPATLLIRFTTTDQTTGDAVVSESGARIDLRP